MEHSTQQRPCPPQVLDREEWMDNVAPEDMSEAQQNAMKEYEEKAAKLREEQDKSAGARSAY